ncbi:MAG: molecular chaperone [Deltaproteobacteria bacterium]|nr:molecular chaperone [Deltaproteobacteria bacterium]
MSSTIAANFTITPIRVFFDSKKKTEALKVINRSDSGLSLQVSLVHWAQDTEGKDIYTPTTDIVFFPKIISILGGEERIIRIGPKVKSGATEKTYRIFVEEMKAPQSDEDAGGASVRARVKIGVPIFISPAEALPAIEFLEFSFLSGVFDITLKNTGNIQQWVKKVKVRALDFKGDEIFTKEVNGTYLLSGITRIHSLKIPAEKCSDIMSLDVEVTTDRLTISERLDVTKDKCSE